MDHEVRGSIHAVKSRLTSEFFPAYLSVTLIDAVFDLRIRSEARATSVTDQYRRHIAIERRRRERWHPLRRTSRSCWTIGPARERHAPTGLPTPQGTHPDGRSDHQ